VSRGHVAGSRRAHPCLGRTAFQPDRSVIVIAIAVPVQATNRFVMSLYVIVVVVARLVAAARAERVVKEVERAIRIGGTGAVDSSSPASGKRCILSVPAASDRVNTGSD
jgi:hypothetical protein